MREPGFYWTRLKYHNYEPAEWTGSHWILIGSDDTFNDNEFTSIGDRIVKDGNHIFFPIVNKKEKAHV